MTIRVPNTNTFSLQDVYDSVNSHASPSPDLSSCFANANPSYFDSNYNNDSYAPANSMLRFRNYTPFESIILYGTSGTTNHWEATSMPPGNNENAWNEAVYDLDQNQSLHIIYSKDSNIGYAGHHNDNIYPATTRLHRSFLEFDTTFLGSNATVISAKLRLYAAAHEHFGAPAIVPIQVHIVSSSMLMSSSIDEFPSNSWYHMANMWSRGILNVDDWQYKYYDIDLEPFAIDKTRVTWLTPRLNHWDYNYDTSHGIPSDLMAIKYYINKTGNYAPQLILEYSN